MTEKPNEWIRLSDRPCYLRRLENHFIRVASEVVTA